MAQNVALDSNLLVLYCVGVSRPEKIGSHKRLRPYRKEDFNNLRRIMSGAENLVIISYSIAEVSNLLDKDALWQSVYLPVLRELVGASKEIVPDSARVLRERTTEWLGVTDSAWLHLLDDDTLFLTSDSRLFAEAQRVDRKALLLLPLQAA